MSDAALAEVQALLSTTPPGIAEAVAVLARVANEGDARADYALAQLGIGPRAGLTEHDTLRHWHRAAQAGLPAALRAYGLMLLSHGRQSEAAGAFDRASVSGDRLARQLRSALSVESTPLSDAPPDSLDGHRASPDRVLHAEPYVATIDGAMTRLESAYLIALAGPHLKRATTVNPVTGEFTIDPSRTNREAPLDAARGDLATRWLEARLARLAGTSIEYAEYMTVLCYQPGEQYRPHRDYFVPAALPDQFAPTAGGQRRRTLFVYLNPVAEGGETDFPKLGVRVSPSPGMAVTFVNVRPDGEPDPDTLHAGMPVVRGQKWLATAWYRERPLRPF